MREQTLSDRAAAGSVWVFASKIAQQILSLVQLVILGRLLPPEDFGLLSIALLAIQALSVFVYTGQDFALVQFSDLQEEDIHTAWWITFGRQAFIGLTLIVLARPIATLYGSPKAAPIIIVISITQIALGLANPTLGLLQRELQFRKVFYYQVGNTSVGLIAGVIATLMLRNVWGLVIGTIAASLAQILLSYALHPFRPGWRISKASTTRFLNFGKWMLGSAIVWFALSQGSNAFSGWMFGVAALGLYQISGRFALLPSTQFTEVVIGAFLPAFSLIQEDVERVSNAFLRMFSISIVLIFSSTTLIALGLPDLFVVILGEKWQQAASLIPALAIAGGARAVVRTGSPLYLGTGNPHFQFWLDTVQTIVMALLLYPLGRWFGLNGLSYAATIGGIAGLPVWWIGIRRTTNCTLWQIIQIISPSCFGAMLMVILFKIGQMPEILYKNSITSVVWNIALMILATVGFFVAIWKLEGIFPNYKPLPELKRVLNSLWLRFTPLLAR
jgi:O-antigen/teichoic acid export membrane protein